MKQERVPQNNAITRLHCNHMVPNTNLVITIMTDFLCCTLKSLNSLCPSVFLLYAFANFEQPNFPNWQNNGLFTFAWRFLMVSKNDDFKAHLGNLFAEV